MKRELAWLAAFFLVTSSAWAQVGDSSPKEGSKDFGTSSFFTPLDAYAMQPYNSGFINNRAQNSSTGNLNCSGASTESRAIAQINLPHGADIEALRIWGTDNSGAANVVVTLIEACMPDATAAAPILTTLAVASSTGTPGLFTDVDFPPSGDNIVDNQSCAYRVEVRLGPNTSTCDINLFFSKARVQWGRFIPPEPAVATFTDVPTGSQFFREVEAFANTGITAGCTLTEFCPDTFVTRLQMAAFFARALGLAPPQIADPANP